MFSLKEKQFIASEVEKLIISLDHPEMPKEKPMFALRIEGKENWSWAEIKPNWTFGIDNPPGMNSWNEIARDELKKREED